MEFDFTLTGRTSLLMSADNIEASEEVKKWQEDPENRKISVAGDDRSPPWTWMARLHHDGEYLAMPSEVLMAIFREAGKKMKVKGKGMQTFKGESQSALFIDKEYCELLIGGKRVSMVDILAIKSSTFAEQAQSVKDLGFSLFMKRVVIRGNAKTSRNVRIRAKFNDWVVKGRIEIVDTTIMTEEVLNMLFAIGGSKCGALDNRPNAGSPGSHGQFDHKLVRVA